jgi:alanyl-tRNA synthetase
VAELLRTSEPELMEQAERLIAHQRALEKEIEQLKNRIAQAQARGLESQVREIKGVKVLAGRVDGMDRAQMRAMADALRNKWGSAVVVLAAAANGGIAILSAVTSDITSRVHAGTLLGEVAKGVGGRGGGRPDLAEGGGKDVAALDGALATVYPAVEAML